MYIQISVERGCMKEKTLNSRLSGFLIIMLMPVVMKEGLLKSTTRSRSWKQVLTIGYTN